LVKILHDLKLMEAEGSGYDMIYEKLVIDAKALPEVDSDFNKVSVSLQSKIVDIEALNVVNYISNHFELTGREEIFIGIVAQHKKILVTELVKNLQLPEEERLRSWYTRLRELKIIKTQGEGKGTAFVFNPKLLADSKLNIKPTLKTIEPHRLKALIVEDLQIHPRSKSSEIQERIVDIPIEEIRRILKQMEKTGVIKGESSRRHKVYILAENH